MTSAFGLPWTARYKVALGIADAIAYLHNGTEQCVVHRDIKPSNILLSSKKIPKVKLQIIFQEMNDLFDDLIGETRTDLC